MPAIAAPIPTITRSFLFFGSFTAVTPSTRFTFECTIGSRGQRSLRCNKRAADRQNAARGRPSCTRSSPTDRKPGWRSPTQRICEISNPRFDIREAASANAILAPSASGRRNLVTTGSVISLNIGTSMRGGCTFLFEQRVERVGVSTEFTKMLSGATLGKLAPAPAFVVTKDARPLQVSHDRRIAVR